MYHITFQLEDNMKRNTLSMLIVGIVLVLATLACNFSASTANIKEVVMAKDEAGTQVTTEFSPTDTFYCLVTLANAPSDTKIKAAWTAVKVEGAAENTALDQSELTMGDGTATFNMKNNGPWPVGSYKVDLYLNDKLTKTVEFSVK
jgi:hypothetical protein